MEKKLLSFSALLVACGLNAQITITSSDMPSAGVSYFSQRDTNVTSAGPSGPNQTWDFSSWGNHGKDTTTFLNPSSMQGFSHFPGATLGIGNNDEGEIYLTNNFSSLEILGMYSDFAQNGNPFPVLFSPPQKFITFPSTYQTTFSGTSNYSVTVPYPNPPADSIRRESINNYSSVMDGWGTISTPAFSNVSVLRQKRTEIHTSTTYARVNGVWTSIGSPSTDTSYNYLWWSDVHSYNMAEISADAANIVTEGRYYTSSQVGIMEKNNIKPEVSVYPNPVSEKIFVNGAGENSAFFIFDAAGKFSGASMLRKNSGVNVASYPNGIYMYQVVDKNGSVLSSGTFEVKK